MEPRMYTPSDNFLVTFIGFITSLFVALFCWPLEKVQAPLWPPETACSSLKDFYLLLFEPDFGTLPLPALGPDLPDLVGNLQHSVQILSMHSTVPFPFSKNLHSSTVGFSYL